MDSKVLVLTNKEDITADFIIIELQTRGIEYYRFNTEDFPNKVTSTCYINNMGDFCTTFNTQKGNFALNSFTSILYRRPGIPLISKDIKDPGVSDFCKKESEEYLNGNWMNFDGVWVSYPPNIFKAQNKLHQLKIAKKLGFNIPNTLISNNAGEIESFIKEHNYNCVIKAVRQGVLKDNNQEKIIYTSKLRKEDIKNIDDFTYTPSIYQEYIEKSPDLRVNVVGNKVIAFEIIISNTNESIDTTDWRRIEDNRISYRLHNLPKYIEKICLKLVKVLGLNFGAIDLALHDGNYYFFEINPNGQWAWLELKTDVKLSKVFVDFLLTGQ